MDAEFVHEHRALIAVAEACWNGSPSWHVLDWMCFKLRAYRRGCSIVSAAGNCVPSARPAVPPNSAANGRARQQKHAGANLRRRPIFQVHLKKSSQRN